MLIVRKQDHLERHPAQALEASIVITRQRVGDQAPSAHPKELTPYKASNEG
jgi:hypothetical protein